MTFYMVSLYHKTTHPHVVLVLAYAGLLTLCPILIRHASTTHINFIPSLITTRFTVTFNRSGSTACHDLFCLLVTKRNLSHVLDFIRANAYSQTGSEAKYRIRVV